MCEFHGSNGNGFGDIWWTDNPIYFSSIDIVQEASVTNNKHCEFAHLLDYFIHILTRYDMKE